MFCSRVVDCDSAAPGIPVSVSFATPASWTGEGDFFRSRMFHFFYFSVSLAWPVQRLVQPTYPQTLSTRLLVLELFEVRNNSQSHLEVGVVFFWFSNYLEFAIPTPMVKTKGCRELLGLAESKWLRLHLCSQKSVESASVKRQRESRSF